MELDRYRHVSARVGNEDVELHLVVGRLHATLLSRHRSADKPNFPSTPVREARHTITTLDLYQRQLHADGRSPHTVDSYLRDLQLSAAHLGDVEVRTVTPDRVAPFIHSDAVQKHADGTPKAAISVNHLRAAARMFAHLFETGGLDRKPAAGVKGNNCGAQLG